MEEEERDHHGSSQQSMYSTSNARSYRRCVVAQSLRLYRSKWGMAYILSQRQRSSKCGTPFPFSMDTRTRCCLGGETPIMGSTWSKNLLLAPDFSITSPYSILYGEMGTTKEPCKRSKLSTNSH